MGRPTTQSDVPWSYGPELAVDGDPNTCSFTTRQEGQRWWQVLSLRKAECQNVRSSDGTSDSIRMPIFSLLEKFINFFYSQTKKL